MTEPNWNERARMQAGERFRRASAEMGQAMTEAIVEAALQGLDEAPPASRESVGEAKALESAGGIRVLDVACGAGEPAITLAERLQGRGHVVGLDRAEAALEVARKRAAGRRLENVEFVAGDVHEMDFAEASFHRITCRLGVMFFDDEVKALREMNRVLRPGGRVALLAWGTIHQPYFEMIVGSILRVRKDLEIPPAAQRMFRFGESGRLTKALAEAGFAGIEERGRKLRWDWHGEPEELWEYFRGITAPFHTMLEQVAGDQGVSEAVLGALRQRWDGEWVRMEAETRVATAQKV